MVEFSLCSRFDAVVLGSYVGGCELVTGACFSSEAIPLNLRLSYSTVTLMNGLTLK